MVFNSRPVPPTAAARYRKSLRLIELNEVNELNELNDLDCFAVLLSIYFLTSLPEKTLGDLLAHSSDIASGVPHDDKK
jgi:hypothetical protein